MAIIESGPRESIYYDRYDGPMMRWLETEGLPADASDQQITERMESFLEMRKGITAPWMDEVSIAPITEM